MIIRLEGAPCQVWLVHYYPEQGKSGGLVRTYLTNLITGRSWSHKLGPELELEEVAVERKAHSFLYEDADQCWLMDTQTFEQIGIPTALIGKRRPFLGGGMPLSVANAGRRSESIFRGHRCASRFYSTRPHTSFQKARRTDNGVELSVPLFVEAGDMVRIDIDLLTALSCPQAH
jgi:elongation factor P